MAAHGRRSPEPRRAGPGVHDPRALTASPEDGLLVEQIAYYRARAAEYDRELYHAGVYQDHPVPDFPGDAPDDPAGRAAMYRTLEAFGAGGDVLEIACGTGWWTQRLVQSAASLTALDASPEMIEINRQHVGNRRVHYVVADIFTWTPPRRYDVVFFGLWLTHVPPSRFEDFWRLCDRALAPAGRVLFFDEMFLDASLKWQRPIDPATGETIRHLKDGRRFRMVKVYYEPVALEARLHALGWDIEVGRLSTRFFFGRGGRLPRAG